MSQIQSGLFTDLYELTMMQGYIIGEKNVQSQFDMFFRRQPFNGGFSIFAGLDPLLSIIENISFSSEDIEYLRSLGMFRDKFLEYLREFKFTGDIYAVDEGTAVFPNEPLIRVHAPLSEAQLLESVILNIINYQTLVATKAARIYSASNKGIILEFGMRRAHGINGALSATRASFIGGAAATSNTLAGKQFGIPAKGTMAHSWVMAFNSEHEAFEKYAELYPNATIVLIDTYSTLESGIKNAIEVGKRLKEKGLPFGVRLDSGDLYYLSRRVREELDKAGLTEAKIAVSNELNEEIIHQLVTDNAPIDIWGVGTQMVTGGSESSLTGVYKLAAIEKNGIMTPRMKISNNPEKTTNPGIKNVYRFYDKNGYALNDLMAETEKEITEGKPYTLYHQSIDYKKTTLYSYETITQLLNPKMQNGAITAKRPSLEDIQKKTYSQLDSLSCEYKRIINPHIYKVSLTRHLKEIKNKIAEEHSTDNV